MQFVRLHAGRRTRYWANTSSASYKQPAGGGRPERFPRAPACRAGATLARFSKDKGKFLRRKLSRPCAAPADRSRGLRGMQDPGSLVLSVLCRCPTRRVFVRTSRNFRAEISARVGGAALSTHASQAACSPSSAHAERLMVERGTSP